MATEHLFDSRETASAAAAEQISARVDARLRKEATASFVVSGGSSPRRCFELLSNRTLEWERVQIVLSDERWVPNVHADSNERLVRETLLQGGAGAARLTSVYQDDMSVDERCDSLQTQFPESGFACALVGMGTDGHFASLFPGAHDLAAGLDPDSRRFYVPVRTDASPHPRISMTLGALLQSDEILLLIFGDEKLRIYNQANSGNESFPVAHLLRQRRVPVQVVWAP